MARLLYIAHRVPYPPDKGERVRAFQEILALSRHFEVTVAALSHGKADIEAAGALAEHGLEVLTAPAGNRMGLLRGGMSLLVGKSVTEGYFHSRRLGRLVAAAALRERFDIVLCYSSSTLPYALAIPAGARVADLGDVDSAKWLAYAAASRWPKSWIYAKEARGVRQLEQHAVERCDAVVLVSRAEVAALALDDDKVIAVSNGVDCSFFAPDIVEAAAVGPANLVFTGTMDYRPNVEGVCWFVREVWPGLKAEISDLTFTIAGRDPVPAVRRLRQTEGVIVTGSVPDVRPYLQGAALAVCPLHIARGIQNKVLEAMAMGKAVVGSAEALEGIEIQLGVEAIQADSPAQWRQQIARLLGDDEARNSVGDAARACVETKYTWSARMAPLVSLCLRLSGRTAEHEAAPCQPTAVGRCQAARKVQWRD